MVLVNILTRLLVTLLTKLIIFYNRMQKGGNTIVCKCKNFILCTTCGQLVVFYIYQKSRGLTLEDILRKYFSPHNRLRNDLLVRDFVKLHYHHGAKVMDPNFIRCITE